MNKSVYYYTSTDTATKILTGGEIWATNVRFMNDSEEFVNGLKEISSLVQEEYVSDCVEYLSKLDYVKIYTISFCGREDALSQWFMYAKECGVSLEMDFTNYGQPSCYALAENNSPKYSINGQIELEKVIYCTTSSESMPAQEKQNAHDEIESHFKVKCPNKEPLSAVRQGIVESALLIKRYEFFQENEYRAIINLDNLCDENCNPIFYRTDNNVIKSYVKVKYKISDKITGWPIVAIMIGPGFNQNVVFDSMKLFLDSAELCVPKVTLDVYVERILKYLYNAANKITNMRDRKKFKKKIDSRKNDFNSEFVGRIFLVQMRQQLLHFLESVKTNCKFRKQTIAELDEYIKCNYFSLCGIVLKKSSIPYIF